MALVAGDDGATELEYDGLGRMIVKRVYRLDAGQLDWESFDLAEWGKFTAEQWETFRLNNLDEARHYYYDIEGRVLSEWLEVHDEPGPSPKRRLPEPMIRLEREYVWGPRGLRDLILRDRRVIVTQGTVETVQKERLYALQDSQFNVTALAQMSLGAEFNEPIPTIVEEYLYQPYGGFLVRAQVDGQTQLLTSSPRDWNLLFGGNRFDEQTGLYYIAGEPYHPGLGRRLVGGTIGVTPESVLYARVETPESSSGYSLSPLRQLRLREAQQNDPYANVKQFGIGVAEGFGVGVVTYVAWAGATVLLGPVGFWGGAIIIGGLTAYGVANTVLNWDQYDTETKWRIGGNIAGGLLSLRPGRFAAHSLAARVKFARDIAFSERFIEWKHNAPSTKSLSLAEGYPYPPKSYFSRTAEYWFERHGLEMLYRGDRPLSSEGFLSSVARGKVSFRGRTGIEASRQLAAELEELGYDPRVMRAKFHDTLLDPPLSPFSGEPAGGAGIPFSEYLPVAAGYAQRGGNVYSVLLPRGRAPLTIGWRHLWWEYEHVALHHVPARYVLGSVPGSRLPNYIPAGGRNP